MAAQESHGGGLSFDLRFRVGSLSLTLTIKLTVAFFLTVVVPTPELSNQCHRHLHLAIAQKARTRTHPNPYGGIQSLIYHIIMMWSPQITNSRSVDPILQWVSTIGVKLSVIWYAETASSLDSHFNRGPQGVDIPRTQNRLALTFYFCLLIPSQKGLIRIP